MFPENTNTIVNGHGGGEQRIDRRVEGREIVETKVVGKDESTRLA